jgi:hypothetical protein
MKYFPGLLCFICYYELMTALKFPFSFTVDRVTHDYRYQAPLLGFFELDLVLVIILLLLVGKQVQRHRRVTGFLIASTKKPGITL